MTRCWVRVSHLYHSRGWVTDAWVVVLYWLAIVVGSYWGHRSGHWTTLPMFGWENGAIAENLVRGQGFAGAIDHNSGPTAWMPPLLPWIYSLIFWLFGIRTQAAIVAAFGLKSLAMALTLQQLLALLRKTEWKAQRWILYLLSFVFLWLDQLRTFYELEDVWLQNLLICLALSALFDLSRDCGTMTWRVALTALLLPLSSPVSTASFYVASLTIVLRALRLKQAYRAQILALLLSACVAGSWMMRNRAVLGEAYPIKSNVWFDFMEANRWDDDGILSDTIFSLYHPNNPNIYRTQYLTFGEKAFLDYYHQEAARVATDEWLRRCLRRAINATVFLISEIDTTGATGLSLPDQCELFKAGLLSFFGESPLWLNCNWDETRFNQALERVPLNDKVGVLRSRGKARAYYRTICEGWDRWLWGVAHASLPTLAILVILLSPAMRRDPLALITICFYVFFEIPYILVSHYERYQVCLTSAQWLLIALAYSALVHRPRKPEEWRRERLCTALLFAYLTALGMWWADHVSPASQLCRFGWEYGNIGASLLQGKGFSDAMGPGSGPTAWMPPVLPCIYALVFSLAGVKTAASICLACVLRSLAGGLCLFFLQGWCRRLGGVGAMRAAAVLALFFLYLDRDRALGELHDPWFVNLCGCVTLEILIRLSENPQRGLPRPLLLGAFLLPMASPAFLGSLIAGLLWLCLWPLRRPTRPMVAVILLTSLACILWGVRNQKALGHFYPIKSNFVFELTHAQLYEDSGLFSASYAALYHPVGYNENHRRYMAWGEARFLEAAAQDLSKLDVPTYCQRVFSRLVNATWRLQSDLDIIYALGIPQVLPVPIPEEQLDILVQVDLLRYFRPCYMWIYIHRDPAAVTQAILALPLRDVQSALFNRERAVYALHQHESEWDRVLWAYAFTLLPSLACILCIFGRPASRSITMALVAYAAYLLPYILVQHYARFQVSDVYLQIFLEIAAIQVLRGMGSRGGLVQLSRCKPVSPP